MDQVYIRPVDVPGSKVQVSSEGGSQPIWRTQNEIYFRYEDQMLMARIRVEPELTVERPEVLFEGPYLDSGVGPFAGYDVTPDGERFLMMKKATADEAPITIVLNWFEDLKQRVPAD